MQVALQLFHRISHAIAPEMHSTSGVWACWRFLVCALLMNLSGLAQAQSWESVGRAPIYTSTAVSETTMVFSPDGTPYLAFKDQANGRRVAVKRLNSAGTGWERVGGSAVSPGWVTNFSLAFGPDGRPYVAYGNSSDGKKANVKRLNARGTAWESVGDTSPSWAPGFSEGEVDEVSLAFGSDGKPIVAFKDVVNGSRATVMRLNAAGTGWDLVGPAGFSEGQVGSVSLAVGPGNQPYVAFGDAAKSYKATVMRLNSAGTAWETVGSSGISAGSATQLSIAFSPDGAPFVAYQDSSFTNSGIVERWDAADNSWKYVAQLSSQPLLIRGISMAFAPDGKLYVAYRNRSLGNKATVERTNATYTQREVVGLSGFSDGEIEDISMATSPDGTPYVAYVDRANGSKATVMSLNAGGAQWTPVGASEFSMGLSTDISLALAPNGVPYLAYSDKANRGMATVIRLNSAGTTWEPVGLGSLSVGAAAHTSLAFGPDGKPYVAYQDGANEYKATVMRMNADGSAWESVGIAGFSEGAVSYTSLKFGTDGKPYLAFQDGANGGRATVMRVNAGGTAWEIVGTPGFSPGAASYTSLAFGLSGEPYVGFQDGANGGKATVMRWNPDDSTWEVLGNAGFSSGTASYLSLAVNPEGTPYLAFQGPASAYQALLMRLNAAGTAWENVGTGNTFWKTDHTSLAFGPNGKPYVAYTLQLSTGQAKVMGLNDAGTTWADIGESASAGNALETSLVFGPDGKAYVAYLDSDAGGIPTVKRWSRTFASSPGAPRNAVAVAGSGSATISFDPPSDTGGYGIPILEYTVQSLPGNFTCNVGHDPNSARQSCSINGLLNGVGYTFMLSASNAIGSSATVRTNEVVPEALSLNAPAEVASALRGRSYELRLNAGGGAGSYVYSLDPDGSPLPDGLSLDGVSGLISGTPTAPPGTYSIRLNVTDGGGETAFLDLTLVISAAPVTAVPTLSQWLILLLGLVIAGSTLGARRVAKLS